MKRIKCFLLFSLLISCNKGLEKESEKLNLQDWVDSEYVKVNTNYYLKYLDLDYKDFLLKSNNLQSENELINVIKQSDKSVIDAVLNNKIIVKNKIIKKIESKVKNLSIVKYRQYMFEIASIEVGVFKEKIIIKRNDKNDVLLIPYNTNKSSQLDSILSKKFKSKILLKEIKSLLNYKKFIARNTHEVIIEKAFNEYFNYLMSNNIEYMKYLKIPKSYMSLKNEDFMDLLKVKPSVPFKGFFLNNIEKVNCFDNLFILDYDIDLGNNVFAIASRVLVQIDNGKVFFLFYDGDGEDLKENYGDIFNSMQIKCIRKKMKDVIFYKLER